MVFDHRNEEFSFVKSLSGRTVSDTFWQNLLRYWHMPRKRCTPDLSVGVGIFVIASECFGWVWFDPFIRELVTDERDKRFKLKRFHRQSEILLAALF